MKVLLINIICIFLSVKSFCQINKNNQNERNISLLKQLTYCKCLTASLRTFGHIDSAEISLTEISNKMETSGLFDNIVGQILDSLVDKIVNLQIVNKQKNDPFKSEGANGKTTYILSCLEFYQSKQLDSILRAMPKSKYLLKYAQ